MNELDGIIREFLVESYENLDQLDRDLVGLEKNPHDPDRLASVFRTIHTIKGTCGFFEFTRLGALTHAGENLLSQLRDGKLVLNPEITTALLSLVDAVRRALACIETTGRESDASHAELIATLTELHSPGSRPDSQSVVPAAEETSEPPGGSLSEGNIRVDVGLLDRLMNLVGELVLARNQILQFAGTQPDTPFHQASQRLNLITTELQEGVTKTRMQPIGNLWNKFPRVVRDLAIACGKTVRVSMEGKDTELDKTILEAIKDPLTHLVRNAIDHGLEKPDVRRQAGKPEAGHLSLRAFHEGGQVNIEVSDDGRGMDPERIRQKALERGLITADQAARLGDRELFRLVFLPGFSTAEKVTNISGRGVGMDVVKTNIERIGGTVDIQSRPGQGSTVKVKIPLTLAIIPALIVTSGGDRYAIPQVSLLELVRLKADQASRHIEALYGTPVYRLRGNLLPLVHLDRILHTERGGEDRTEAVNIIVLQADERQFGLVVEGISDTEEIVVKPLGKHLKDVPLFAGATIMGDGQVALILDVLGIAQSAGVIAEVRDRALAEAEAKPAGGGQLRQPLLLFQVGADCQMALMLDQVARLEEIPRSAVERASGQEVVQYRGQILPLLHLDRLLPGAAPAAGDDSTLQVVVYSEQGRSVGVVVRRILDIVEAPLDIQLGSRRHGILGTAVIQQRITDLLDVKGIVSAAAPDLFGPACAGRSQP